MWKRFDSTETPVHHIPTSCRPKLYVTLLDPEKILHIAGSFWARELPAEVKDIRAGDVNRKQPDSDQPVLVAKLNYE